MVEQAGNPKPPKPRLKIPLLDPEVREASRIARDLERGKIDLKSTVQFNPDDFFTNVALRRQQYGEPKPDVPYGEKIVDHNHPFRYLEDMGYGDEWEFPQVRGPLLDIYVKFRNGQPIEDFVSKQFADPDNPNDHRKYLSEAGRQIFNGYIAYLQKDPTQAIVLPEEDAVLTSQKENTSKHHVIEPTEERPSREATIEDIKELVEDIDADLATTGVISFELEKKLGQFDLDNEQIKFLSMYIDWKREVLGITKDSRS